MSPHALIALFWFSLAVLFYTFLGYPLLVAVLARLARRRPQPAALPSPIPAVAVVLAAYNEESRIAARLQNLLACDYPAEKLRIVVVSDGATDGTVARVESLGHGRIQLIPQAQRRGKAAALNRALVDLRKEIVVFADVRQDFAPDAITRLVRHFADPRTGAVSGELIINPAASAVGGGVDAYWRLEKFIRQAEARRDSSIGCTGAIYAIRGELFRPLPPDTILDDVVIPMSITQQGFRVAFEPAATAYDPQPLDPAREQIRKRRTLAGNYQMLFRHPGWLLPWRNRLWWQLISHKYLRLAAPFFLVLLLACNALLLATRPYDVLFLGQCAFYVLALAGLAFHSRKIKLLSLPAGFVFLNWMSAAGLWQYLRATGQPGWQSASLETPAARPHTPDV